MNEDPYKEALSTVCCIAIGLSIFHQQQDDALLSERPTMLLSRLSLRPAEEHKQTEEQPPYLLRAINTPGTRASTATTAAARKKSLNRPRVARVTCSW